MFRLLKLKPPHGWSAIGWELLIVTLGVLIALGAQQMVEAANWRREVAGFRDSVRGEISRDLWTYPYRSAQKRCINARLDELQHWLDSWRAGRPLTLTGPIGIPVSAVIRTSAWDGRDAGTLAHMSRSERRRARRVDRTCQLRRGNPARPSGPDAAAGADFPRPVARLADRRQRRSLYEARRRYRP